MKATTLAALLVLMTTGPAAAHDEYRWIPYGSISCGKWLARKPNAEGVNSWHRITLASWLSGFISAANAYLPGKENWLEGSDIDSAMLWIDKYCADNPLSQSAIAGQALIEELRSR